MQIRINEIFKSISGEAGHPAFPQGTFCTFVRFQGCNFASNPCLWCDTQHSQNKEAGELLSVGKIISTIGIDNYIVITGGEPLFQQFGLSVLVRTLLGAGKKVQIETNGSFIPVDFGVNCAWVLDYKLPSSGVQQNMISNFGFLEALKKQNAVIKFVFDTVEDITVMFEKINLFKIMMENIHLNLGYAPFIVSPTENGKRFSKKVVETIFDQNLQDYCLFSLQSHKILDLK